MEDNACLVVSGFVSDQRKWARYDEQLSEHLVAYEIVGGFHMTEFEAGSGQYGPWRKDTQRRDAFLLRFTEIVRRNTNKGFSAAVVIPDLRRLFMIYEAPVENPYPWCAQQALMMMSIWSGRRAKARTAKGSDQLRVVFERGDKHAGELMAIAKEDFGLTIEFLPKRNGPLAFQACDWLAWEHRKALSNHVKRDYSQFRESLAQLRERFHSDQFRYSDWNTLVKVAEKFGYPKREGAAIEILVTE